MENPNDGFLASQGRFSISLSGVKLQHVRTDDKKTSDSGGALEASAH